ncbi:GNAT family N-acetyltransferase [Ginsengibacter hankyongi]|uniref:GNAT family N-acetyltransferase n=1 Tax=Ginsengibacter hankyongi TaxID=2607284 RepID=A0A5J5INW3_9BACT|nr:GNAT family N-acetyltransferase [Ginsengibacter hankyongi]KAA9041697.1 GNAT family N-acetyltransferase [Ginsengibacter hankyongi]
MHVIFETPRLFLRRFTEADAKLIYKLNSDPEIVKYVHEPVLENEEQAKKILTDFILPQYKLNLGRWAIHTKADYEFIGWCGLKYIKETGIIDLGYRLLKTAWGKGYATEAAQYTLIYGLRDLKIKVITGMAHVENIASIKVLEKIGMKFTRDEIIDGQPVKVYTLSLPETTDIC